MTALSLAVVLASALISDLPAEELIVRLGSHDRVVREEASRTLVERGPDALAALRAARQTADGAEARDRLDALIDAAEAGLLGRPTAVALDVDDRPLAEAVAALAARSGYALALDDPALADRRVTARSEGPLPFWEALDRLSRAGHVRHDPGPRHGPQGDVRDASVIQLVDGDPPGFTAYGGPLRVHLFATHRHRDLDFQAPAVGLLRSPPSPGVTAEVQAFAEPGRFVDPAGPPRLEVVDDRGRPLPRAAGGGGEVPGPSEHSWLTPGRLSLLQWHLPLDLPDPPPGMPLRLRCVLPVVVSARRPDPLVVPLAHAAGKTFRHPGGMAVTVDRVTPLGSPTTVVALTLAAGDASVGRDREPSGVEPDPVTDLRAGASF